jgi:pyruvate ferredoxin oxidoreductase delta subunit
MSAEALKGWRDVPIGGAVMEPGSYAKVNTGSWRTYVPVCDYKKCIHCMQCWIMCPDSSRIAKDAKMIATDLEHCKGCGICADVCPVHCIEMKLESEIKPGEPKG